MINYNYTSLFIRAVLVIMESDILIAKFVNFIANYVNKRYYLNNAV